MNKPNKVNHEHWVNQAVEYEIVLNELASKYNVHYIDCWNNYSQYVVDSTHLNVDGHLKMFQEIQGIIG
jgi:hypothetical protein